MIWCLGQTALFLFLLIRAAPAFLPTAISVALRPLFPFRQAQYAQVFPLKSAPFCTLFAGLGSTNKSAISLLFYYLTLVLSSPPCPLLHLSCYLKLCGRSGGTVFSLLFSGHSFLPGNDAADELARRGALLAPSAIPCSLSPLVSDWRRTVSSKFFDTQVPSISTEELVLPRHARCVLSRLRCNGHSLLLGSYLSRIGRTENPSCSACGHSSQDISHLILHCPATDSLRRSLFGDSLSRYDLWSRPWGVARILGSMVFRHAPIPRKGSGRQQQQLISEKKLILRPFSRFIAGLEVLIQFKCISHFLLDPTFLEQRSILNFKRTFSRLSIRILSGFELRIFCFYVRNDYLSPTAPERYRKMDSFMFRSSRFVSFKAD